MPPCRAYLAGHLDSPDWEGPQTNKKQLHIVHTNLACCQATCTHAAMHAASTPHHSIGAGVVIDMTKFNFTCWASPDEYAAC